MKKWTTAFSLVLAVAGSTAVGACTANADSDATEAANSVPTK